MTLDGGAFLVPWLTDTPIGCVMQPYYPGTMDCSVEWKLSENDACPIPQNTKDHWLCGAKTRSMSYSGKVNKHETHTSYYETYDAYGNWVKYQTKYGLKVIISRDDAHETGSVFKASFDTLKTNHTIWNRYRMPDLKVTFMDVFI
ncbi:hypothetical protein DPMN_133252 [Dreissena polymorpha]|uniref:Uncharacterized protein n=1 Tax=Dreissena polymorpha TaxID=45954 RepID=A0A9D4FY37_DREPO|nr:hypothetical protein DPMN_133252 [Dreissena polymorpha]